MYIPNYHGAAMLWRHSRHHDGLFALCILAVWLYPICFVPILRAILNPLLPLVVELRVLCSAIDAFLARAPVVQCPSIECDRP